MIQEQSSSHQHHHHHQLPKYGTGGSATGVARASKKTKPKKIPQRGLGVAQLEKLRLEEQKKMMEGSSGGGGGVSVAVALPAAHSRALGGGLLPLHHPPPPSRPPADGGFSPVPSWDPAADPMKHYQYKRMPPLPMVSTGLSLTASSSHPTEPPSNQMYSSSGSRITAAPAPAPAEEDDRESAGLDKYWPFMFEGMTTAAGFRSSTGKAAPATVPFAARMVTREAGFSDVCPDLMSRHEFRATNYFSANANYSDWSPDFAYSKNGKATGCAGEPAFLSSSLSARQPANLAKQPPPHLIPSSAHLPDYSDFGVLQSHHQASENPYIHRFLEPVTLVKRNGWTDPAGEGGLQVSAAAPPPSRPFYSFLPAGPVRCDRALSECRADVSEGVDLELKL